MTARLPPKPTGTLMGSGVIHGKRVELHMHSDDVLEAYAREAVALAQAEFVAWTEVESEPIPTEGLVDLFTGTRRHTDCYHDRICDEWRQIDAHGRIFHIKRAWITHWMRSIAHPKAKPALKQKPIAPQGRRQYRDVFEEMDDDVQMLMDRDMGG